MSGDRPAWTFLSNHGHVLLAIASDSNARMRDIAARVGITERAAQLIVGDLVTAGYVERRRVGRRNEYSIAAGRPFRHPAEADRLVDDLIEIFRRRDDDGDPATAMAAHASRNGGEPARDRDVLAGGLPGPRPVQD